MTDKRPLETGVIDPEPLDDARLHSVLDALKAAVLAVPGACEARLVLYGSRARGDYDSRSDIDIAIIVPGLTKKAKNTILDAVADVEYEHDTVLSTFVISSEDFDWLKRRERRIAMDVESEGITL